MQQQPVQGYTGAVGGFGDTGTYPGATSSSPAYSSFPSAPYPSAPYPFAPHAAPPYTSAPYPAIAPYPQSAQSLPPYVPLGPALPQIQPAPPPLNGSQRALLAALVYSPLALVGYLLYLYGPGNVCMAGPFCGFAALPSPLQAFLMLLGGVLLWLLVTLGLPWLLAAIPWQSRFAVGVRALTEYRLVRPLLGIYGGILTLALLVELFTGRLNPGALILGTLSAYVCLRCAFARPPQPAVQPTYM